MMMMMMMMMIQNNDERKCPTRFWMQNALRVHLVHKYLKKVYYFSIGESDQFVTETL